jgi:hypothetical protein
MDSLTPAVTGSGKQTFTWSMERLYTDKTYMALLLAGTKFDLVFAPEGSPYEATAYETWTDCIILSCEHSAAESDGVLEKLSGEAGGCTPKPA